MTKKESFFKNRIKSIGYALKGVLHLVKHEASIKIQVFTALLAVICGFMFNISTTEWLIQCLAIGLVLSIEGLNTAIETLADFVCPEHHKKIGLVKDIAAGSVALAALMAFTMGCIIYIPKILTLLY